MERKKYFLILIGITFILFFGTASNKSKVYKAYISNDMPSWKIVIDEMNRQPAKSNEFRLELLNYQYGYIAWCIGNKQKKQAENYLELGQKNIEFLEKLSYKPSVINSYKSAFYGFSIGLNVLKAPFIGPKSVECAKLAITQDASNPMGYIQYGNSQYYMPPLFGGSKSVALSYFLKAEQLMEKKHDQVKENWNYLSLLTIIAKAHTELNEKAKAKACYSKILKIEPEFLWVKNELYPEIIK